MAIYHFSAKVISRAVGSSAVAAAAYRSADRLYDELRETGLEVLYDDRDAGPGAKFADAELLGAPLRLTVGRKGIEAGEVEAQVRRGQEKRTLPLDGAVDAAAELWRALP